MPQRLVQQPPAFQRVMTQLALRHDHDQPDLAPRHAGMRMVSRGFSASAGISRPGSIRKRPKPIMSAFIRRSPTVAFGLSRHTRRSLRISVPAA
ncbi:hypothetical protein [Methylobacterium oryzae]|uniref:Uncharacterized protein n=1 Tax=Methylobacterium oryzae TaxID=334852 RepID=A0ABU7TUY2_9HYPH